MWSMLKNIWQIMISKEKISASINKRRNTNLIVQFQKFQKLFKPIELRLKERHRIFHHLARVSGNNQYYYFYLVSPLLDNVGFFVQLLNLVVFIFTDGSDSQCGHSWWTCFLYFISLSTGDSWIISLWRPTGI